MVRDKYLFMNNNKVNIAFLSFHIKRFLLWFGLAYSKNICFEAIQNGSKLNSVCHQIFSGLKVLTM